MVDIGIVIVNWNVRELLARCLDSVYLDLAQSGLGGRVIVVDNDSKDGSAEMIAREFPRTRLIRAENRGMGAGNNVGLRALGFGRQTGSEPERPPFAAVILNPDTVVRTGALRALVNFLRHNEQAGVVAPKLVNGDGSLQHAGFRFPGIMQAALDLFPLPGRLAGLAESPLNGRYPAGWYSASDPFEVEHTLGACFAVRGSLLAGEDLFDEIFPMYCEEIDCQWRLRARGWSAWVAPAAEVVHFGGQSTRQVSYRSLVHLWSSRRRLYQRYHGPLTLAITRGLVELAFRNRIRANHRRSKAGNLAPDARAAENAAYTEILQAWQGRRPPLPKALAP
jgi:hypothetical protein